jgi:hypothetical protein
MKFSPKHEGGAIRALYIGLFALALICMSLPFQNGTRRTAMILISMAALVGAMYLMMRFELTTYTYVLNPRENDYDFFVDKASGKRGNYVCNYLVTDIVKVLPYEKDTKEKLSKEYAGIMFYNYTHNLFSKKKQVIVFRNSPHYDAAIVEMNEQFEAFLENVTNLSKEANAPAFNPDIERELGIDNEE